jgi:type I restriction enzyme M protein
MVQAIDPKVGETVYDPCCGTGGFLAQAYSYMSARARSAEEIETLKKSTFYGREKEDLVYPIVLLISSYTVWTSPISGMAIL